jgi:hypothetical protein
MKNKMRYSSTITIVHHVTVHFDANDRHSNVKLLPATTSPICLLSFILLLSRRPREEDVPKLVDGCNHEPGKGLVRGHVRQCGVCPCRHELLGAAEVLSSSDGSLVTESLLTAVSMTCRESGSRGTYGLELRKVIRLLLVIVVLEMLHQLMHLAIIVRRRNCESVKLLEPLLDILVFLAVVVRELLALGTHLLFHERVHNKLLADGMSCDLPPKLVRELLGGLQVAGCVGLLVSGVVLVHLWIQWYMNKLAQEVDEPVG